MCSTIPPPNEMEDLVSYSHRHIQGGSTIYTSMHGHPFLPHLVAYVAFFMKKTFKCVDGLHKAEIQCCKTASEKEDW